MNHSLQAQHIGREDLCVIDRGAPEGGLLEQQFATLHSPEHGFIFEVCGVQALSSD